MNHLTDMQIQMFADGIAVDPEMTGHLEACELCRSHVSAYQQLMAELKKDEGFTLSPNFSRMVITKLEEKAETATQWKEWLIMALSGAAAVVAAIYFTGTSATGDAVTETVKELFQTRESVVSSFRDFKNWFDGGLSYLIYGGFLLLIFDYLDRKFIRSKRLSGQH